MTTELNTQPRPKIKPRKYPNAIEGTDYITPALKHLIQAKGPEKTVEFYMQARNTLAAIDTDHNPGSFVTNTRSRISGDGFGEGRDGIETDTTDELKARGILHVKCAVKDIAWVARRFSDACGADLEDLERNGRAIRDKRESQGKQR